MRLPKDDIEHNANLVIADRNVLVDQIADATRLDLHCGFCIRNNLLLLFLLLI